jgi:hypothetical protein
LHGKRIVVIELDQAKPSQANLNADLEFFYHFSVSAVRTYSDDGTGKS